MSGHTDSGTVPSRAEVRRRWRESAVIVVILFAVLLYAYFEVRLPQVGPGETVDWFVYVIRLDPAIDRDRVIGELAKRGVPGRPYFSPLHTQPFLSESLGYRMGDFPVTERVARSTLAIPWSALLSDLDVRYVADALVDVVEHGGA